ncbi:MAG: cyclase family protein [Thaumarchaeota archaeon]|nr:MAG: cyclase family protein [Nitrososphaerota archaeon]
MPLLDLTLEISTKLPSFPGSPQPRFISWATNEDDGYNLELIFLSSHSGTHIDAPFHFIENGLKIDKIPLKRLVTDAVLCRIKKGADKAITKQDIIEFENKHGKLQPNSTLIFATGWHKNLLKKYYFTKNPGLSIFAAKYLVKKKISLVGIDSPSIDLGLDSRFLVHHQLLDNGILILENLCNLEKISGVHFKLVVLPLKLKGATGSPVRAIAL